MRSRTLAVISVSDVLSRDSQPGMQACKITGSFNAAKTFSREAAILYSPLISISLSCRSALPLAGIRVRRWFCQWFAQGDVDRRQIRHRHQDRQSLKPVGLRVPEQGADHPAAA